MFFAVPPPPSICIPALLGRLVAVTYKNFVPKDDKNAAPSLCHKKTRWEKETVSE